MLHCAHFIKSVHLNRLHFYSNFRSTWKGRKYISDSNAFFAKWCRSAMKHPAYMITSKPWYRHTVPLLKNSITLQWPRPPKITQSACISCSGLTANPFLIQSYNLEGLSADLPVQATNGWAKGLHWCALCPALPLPWQQREVFCAFSHFSDVVSTVLWTSRRGKSRDEGINHQRLTTVMATGTLQRTWPWPGSNPNIACYQCQAQHNCPARWGSTDSCWHIIKLSLQCSRLFEKWETKCMYAPTHLYLFNDVQS